MKKKSCGLAITRNTKGFKQVLLVQSGWNQPWGLPKGKIEKNETEFECALREVKEELKLTFKLEDIQNSQRHIQYNKRKDIVIFEVEGGHIEPKDIKPRMGEIASFRWFSLDDTEISDICENQFDIITKVLIK